MKRMFDLGIALMLLPLVLPLSIILIFLAKILNGKGVFIQQRIGRYGEPFNLYKVCSMKHVEGLTTSVTTSTDPRITPFGRFIRNFKLDEFPQILNVLKGEMSFVGPRPDVAHAYKNLKEEDSMFLCILPGITGMASVEFKEEEALLASVSDFETYNDTVIFPKKVALNNRYVEQHSLLLDIKIMLRTVLKSP
jgi:lipopolysaccharide/colanic/teichoic acid biosynthesis glycosyltransferase